MGKLKSFLTSFLVYDTTSIVRLHDWRLSLLYYSGLIATLIYTILYGLIYDFGYLTSEVPVGQIRVNPLAPPVWKNVSDLLYCVQPNDTSNSTYRDLPKYPCLYWDEENAVWPQAVDRALTLTTRVKQSYLVLDNCSLSDPLCRWNESNTTYFYLADPESFTVCSSLLFRCFLLSLYHDLP